MNDDEFGYVRWSLVFISMIFLFFTDKISFDVVGGMIVGALVPMSQVAQKLGVMGK